MSIYIGATGQWKQLSDYALGDIVLMRENGYDVRYIVVNQGLPEAMYTNSEGTYDGTCDGTWVLREECYATGIRSEGEYDDDGDFANDYFYVNCTMERALRTFPDRFSSAVQSVIKTANIPARGYGSNGVVLTSLATKAFPLGANEVGGSGTQNGYKLGWFREQLNGANANNDAAEFRVAKWIGSAHKWWLRTSSVGVDYCADTGAIRDGDSNEIKGYRPAMILDSSAWTCDGLVVGGSAATALARRAKAIYTGVNGVARRATKVYLGVDGVAKLVYRTLDSLAPGETVKLRETETDTAATEFWVATHDYESELNGTGRTLLVRKDVYGGEIKWGGATTNTEYATSYLDAQMTTYAGRFSDRVALKEAVGMTKIRCNYKKSEPTQITIERAVFALSVWEVGGSGLTTNAADDGSTALPDAFLANLFSPGASERWWTRTISTTENRAYSMNPTGGVAYAYTVNNTKEGRLPAFTLPGKTQVDTDGNLIF